MESIFRTVQSNKSKSGLFMTFLTWKFLLEKKISCIASIFALYYGETRSSSLPWLRSFITWSYVACFYLLSELTILVFISDHKITCWNSIIVALNDLLYIVLTWLLSITYVTPYHVLVGINKVTQNLNLFGLSSLCYRDIESA